MATNTYPSDPVPREKDQSPSGTEGNSAQSMQEKGRRKAEQAAERAQRSAAQQASQQKERATDRLDRMSDALHTTSDDLRSQEEEQVAQYIDAAAGQIDRLTGYLRDRNVEDLLHETRQLARREPALFLGGAALLGMVGARFLRSSSPDGSRSTSPRDDMYRRDEVYRSDDMYSSGGVQ